MCFEQLIQNNRHFLHGVSMCVHVRVCTCTHFRCMIRPLTCNFSVMNNVYFNITKKHYLEATFGFPAKCWQCMKYMLKHQFQIYQPKRISITLDTTFNSPVWHANVLHILEVDLDIIKKNRAVVNIVHILSRFKRLMQYLLTFRKLIYWMRPKHFVYVNSVLCVFEHT